VLVVLAALALYETVELRRTGVAMPMDRNTDAP